jgi:hypothetical protein
VEIESETVAKASASGKTAHFGTDYQTRILEWIVVRIFAQHGAALPLDLPLP